MKHYFKKVLSALALAFVVIVAAGAVKASAAATLTYQPMTDTIKVDTENCVVYVLKSKEGVTIKSTANYFELAKGSVTPLSELGIKDGTAVYLRFESAAYTEDQEGVKPNFTIEAPTAYKAVGKIDYTQADIATSEAVLSATVTDKSKKEIAGSIIWKGEEDETYSETAAFKGSNLAAMLENGGKLYIKVLGTASVRTSKAFKVSVAKQAKVPSVKLDVKKNTFSIKNGFDFASVTKTGEEYGAVTTWYTVLPYLKDAKTKTADASIVATAYYSPLAKNDKNATALQETSTSKVAYTSYKFKALGLGTLTSKISVASLASDFSFAVRKSATDKKPASQVAYCDITAQKKAPQMFTVANISTCTTIAVADELKFKATEIANNTSAWTGIGEEAVPATNAVVDDAAAKYEMAVVKASDYTDNKIDWSTVSWKTFKKGTAISDKTKTKYYTNGAANATTATVKAGTAKAPATYGGAETIILIRRAGVKGKTVSESVLASEILVTYVYKDANKKFYWEIAPTTADQVLVGADAYHYTLTIKTWQKKPADAAADAAAYGYYPVDKVEGYTALDTQTVITLPTLESNQSYIAASEDENYGGTYDASKKSFTIAPTEETKAGDGLDAAFIKVDTAVTVTIKYEGIDKDPVKLTSTYLGVPINVASYVVAKENYTAALPTSIKGCVVTDTESAKTVTVNEGTEIDITITYTEAD